jgi:hypothetical protein
MADGGLISMPVGMALGGAVLGGAMDKDNPMRGAALGALGGYAGGGALGAMGAGSGTAAGMGGALGNGLTAGTAGEAAGMGLGGGLSAGGGTGMAGAGGLLGGAGSGMAGMGAGISAPTSLLGMSAGEAAPSLSLAGHLDKFANNPEMGEKALSMGGQMLMKDQQAKQGQPVMPGVAPPMMRPQFAAPSFMSSAPSFNPAISGLRIPQNVAANPRMRG